MKVLIIGSSKLPIPAVKGGAVPNLIEELIQKNESEKKLELYCCSLWEKDAEKEAIKYKNTKFIWAKIPMVIKKMDVFLYYILKNIFHKERLLSLGFLFQVIWYTFYIAKIIHINNFDKIVFENSVPTLFALKIYKNKDKYKDKYYIHMHSVPRKYYGNMKEFRECKKLICVSKFVANRILKDKKLSFLEGKIELMYNCIDTQVIKPLNLEEKSFLEKKYNIPQNKKIILFVGRLCKEKGIEEVIKAISLLKREDTILLIVGANFYSSGIVSPYEEKLKELSKKIQKKVYFTGYIDYKEIVFLYNLADIVVLPSMWEEPAGMTIIEAMACKKPVITTYSGGIPEYVGEGNCILLRRDEKISENISQYINKLLKDLKFSVYLSEKAYLRASKYNKDFYYQQFLELLGE